MTTTENALIGRRVRVLRWHVTPGATSTDDNGLMRDSSGDVISVDDNVTVPPGTEGTVRLVDDAGQIAVDWDGGARLSLLPGQDSWEFADIQGRA